MISPSDARLWLVKWRWYGRARRPWRRAALHYELARRRAYAKGPIHGEALEMLRDGRLEIGEHALLEPGVWITGGPDAHIRIGAGSFLNLGVMIAAQQRVEIGAYCMLANGCLVTDADHRFDDPNVPVPWQGFTTTGPTRLGDNVWLGAHVVVTGGVSIGERAVIGANSVVTRDIPARTVAAGVPARVLRPIDANRS
ncbi:DapH/DapD/GlmU-related protein [Conexibacter sp. DBS9H8]|uniref:acyltransferase n=1 Tax=Conexibacter sp. DBS9H8 TaxID=2937801 RepID=UPI00200F484B|nr:acyltransferase [Conexibacter sp. DBS9H8]